MASGARYRERIKEMRETEYPMLKGATYLDHAGTTPCAKSVMEGFCADMVSNLYGNPHSASPSSQKSTHCVDDIRVRVLQFFKADPNDFDVVFVANATAGAKIVAEAFREDAFFYAYHKDSHTSLVGLRELASGGHRCLESDTEVKKWMDDLAKDSAEPTQNRPLSLFSYPAQSNFNGRRLPLNWPAKLRGAEKVYTLLDAAAYVSTAQLDLSNARDAPDFTIVSFYKIFGFPDLGALIVRKDSGQNLTQRKYFGGGTVDMVSVLGEQWHERKAGSLHDQLEDGTLPIHNIMALGIAMQVHQRLYGSMNDVSRHTHGLAANLYSELSKLRHANGNEVCKLYHGPDTGFGDPSTQGPIVAFNLLNASKAWVSSAEFEKLASLKNIHVRVGGVCNPGGIASSLQLAPWELRRNFSAGQRCGEESEIMEAKPTGIIRVSFGAMSNTEDVRTLVNFIQEYFVDSDPILENTSEALTEISDFRVESLTIYPIKSCAGWSIPQATRWEVKPEGLAWDREWCVVHLGTGAALSQKKYRSMALLRPEVDLHEGVLRVRRPISSANQAIPVTLEVPLSADPTPFSKSYKDHTSPRPSHVCGEKIEARAYTFEAISRFFSAAIGTPCTLARFPSGGSGAKLRHAKPHLDPHVMARGSLQIPRPILLSNESPILIICRSSVNRLNELIKARSGRAARAEAFRANIVVSEEGCRESGHENPYAEDSWKGVRIGSCTYEILGPCRRCQMVCVDQNTAEIHQEPFSTLAKTRRLNGKIYFGQHACLEAQSRVKNLSPDVQSPTVMVGDQVKPHLYSASELSCTAPAV